VSEKSLPIWEIHSQILAALSSSNRLVLVAPTGSGKTTQVPQMLLDAGLADEKKIVVLQPRRVAARTVAARVAFERGGKLGGEVGYQIRFEDQTSLGTRISYMTEGILLRWLQDNRALADVGIVVFDEFHERNLLSDVSLALVKHLQQTARPDLKLIVMSATLDAEPVADYLTAPGSSACPILQSEGQSFPVEVRYATHHDERPITEQAADAVEHIVNSGEPGDILVFMPGMGEINSTINALRSARVSERLALVPLHGDLPPDQQDLAFAPNPLRKVVVSTNVAETSVTIDGVRHVIDSGLARVARYDSERGIGTLFLEPISRASADQRKGRAGRTAPGTCHRLWTESAHLNRPARHTPEIQRSDLAEVVLLLHSLGIQRAVEFDWLDKPDSQAVERAEQLLKTLVALNTASGGITEIGRKMLRLPMHPRYSRMLIEAAKYNCVPAASLCAALVSGRDLLMRLSHGDKHVKEARELFEASQASDFYTLMRAYEFARKNSFNVESCRRYGIHAQTARQVEQTFGQILDVAERQGLAGENSKIQVPNSNSEDALLRCLMTGFIDQLCQRRDQGTLECALTEGRHGTLVRESVVQNSSLFVAASIREVAGRGSENLTLLSLATAVKREWIEQTFPDQITTRLEHLYDRTHKRVAAVKLIRFHDLVLHHEHQREVNPEASARALAEAQRKGLFELPLLNHELKQFIARVNLVTAALPELEFPPLDDAANTNQLAVAFTGLTLAKEAQAAPLKEAFHRHLAKEQLGWLDELTPLNIPWPDGRKLKLQYPEQARDEDGEPNSPELQVKLHECFQLKEHPHVCEGRVPVRLWLCSPDGKRLEPTFNWPAFRTNTYPKMRSALQKKFPAVLWV
jgi:ATP-dependent helicase HrpB